jgi:hypothetical protein
MLSDPSDRDAALQAVYPRLIRWYVRRYAPLYGLSRSDFDDVVHDAVLFFLARWQPHRARRPGTFAKFAVLSSIRCPPAARRRMASALPRLIEAQRLRSDPPPSGEEVETLRGAVFALSPALRQLLIDRFGLGDCPPKSARELAGGLETKANVNLKLKLCYRRMRSVLAAREGGV